MKFLIRAKKDIQKTYGDRSFDLKKGETTEISGAGFETVMHHSFGGGFELVKEIAESPEEQARLDRQNAKAKLMAKPKPQLAETADALHLGTSLDKESLADAIVGRQEAQNEK
ncbi:MAG TPA: hypothetical protein VGD05_14115, partial [Pyrinomonadaceae bacterium]